MDKGVYCLVLQNAGCTAEIGALGARSFEPGWHVYTGSARGPGGFARVARHIRVKREGIRAPRWHIDYLLMHPKFELHSAACAPTLCPEDECRISHLLGGSPVQGFGCSDCSCRSHLGYFAADPKDAVARAFGQAGLHVTITTLNIS